MDADRLWGWGRLFGDDGKFRVGRTVVNAVLHALIAFGAALVVCALLATFPAAYFGRLGIAACGGLGCGVGVLGVTLREVVQYLGSGGKDGRSPHLLDRALDIAPSPMGGLAGGIAAWAVVSHLL